MCSCATPARRTGGRGRRSARAGAHRGAVIWPRAINRAAAAAGVAVETIPPPMPHSSIGRVTAVTVTAQSAPSASMTCTETVCPRRARPRARRPRSRRRSRRPALSPARAPRARARGGRCTPSSRSCRRTCAPRSAACRSSRRADRVAEVARAAVLERLELDRPRRRASPSARASARRPASAARTGSWGLRAGRGRARRRTRRSASDAPAEVAHGARRHHVRLAGRRAHPEQREQAGRRGTPRRAPSWSPVRW